jgi:RHS repeat-associated protein
MGYDRRGRKTSLINPDSGTWIYKYNGAGELGLQTDAKGQATRMFYDVLGRMIERREYTGAEGGSTPFVTVSSYDVYADGSTCSYGIGKLCGTWTATTPRSVIGGDYATPETRTTTAFDQGGRATQGLTRIDGQAFLSITTFDPNGRVDKLVYPSGFIVVHRYTAWSGQLDQVAEWANGATGAVHWQANGRFADGQLQTMLVGNVTTSKTYDGFGRVATISTSGGGVQNASYAFDALGNLTSRYDPSAGQPSQIFAYDLLNRLTSDGIGSISYLADGNINVKAGSAYTYVAGSHRLSTGAGNTYSSYDSNGNVGTISNGSGSRALTYTAFNLPSSINGPGGSVSYLHDAAHARIREISNGASSSGLTYYLGGFEQHTRSDNVLEQRHYLRTPEGMVGIVTWRSNAANDARYWHKDHLGSVAVITDASGNVKEKFSYDAWGNRNVITHAQATGDPYDEERGYTGHEQLAEVGLTHMNGRIYDPLTGRFLQADPMIQDPFNGQNYNRYGYVLNNPLSLTDPTGFSWWTTWRRPIIAIAASVATFGAASLTLGAAAVDAGASTAFATVGVDATGALVSTGLTSTGTAVASAAAGFAAGGIQGGNVESAVQGAIFATLNFGIGEVTSGVNGISIFGNYAANVGLHAALGCAQQAAAGGTCRGGALSGGFSAAAGPLDLGLVSHVAIGALASRLGGDKSGNGGLTAAFDYLFNCIAHECLAQGRDAEKTFTDYLRANDAGSLGFNRWYDSQDNFFWGRPDIFSESLKMVWDVKPDSYYGWGSGAAQVGMYTANGIYSAGTAAPLFGSRESITLTGAMNTYEFRPGGSGLVIYRALDASPMERALQQAAQQQVNRILMGPFPTRRSCSGLQC